jgi:hypothetical protein
MQFAALHASQRRSLDRAGTYTERSAIRIAAARGADRLDEEQEQSNYLARGSQHRVAAMGRVSFCVFAPLDKLGLWVRCNGVGQIL